MFVDLICPKCGSPVVWCNGGDVIYDYSSQYKATCPSCGYEDWESKFPRDKGQPLSFATEQQKFPKLPVLRIKRSPPRKLVRTSRPVLYY